jgi:hypothetical protein
VKPERVSYLSEMAAAAGAVTVFIAVYVVGFMQTGVLLTLLLGWVPAAALAWLTARAMRSAARTMIDLAPALGVGDLVSGPALQPIEVRAVRRDDRSASRDLF